MTPKSPSARTLPRALVNRRRELGKQRGLAEVPRAEAARFIGTSPQRYEDWEMKGTIPHAKHWPKLREWLDVDATTLKMLVATTLEERPLVQSALSEGWR